MRNKIDDICPRPQDLPPQTTEPLAPPIYLSSVYRCRDTVQAEAVLAHTQPGYAYSRDGHPNADLLAEKCRALHGADEGAVVASGMGALALALLSQCSAGDHLVVSNQLYGRTHQLLVGEAARLGITSTLVDVTHLTAIDEAVTDRTRLVVAETISNPLLRVAPLKHLAEVSHRAGALLVIDNTIAGPAVCRPLEHGADLVVESLTKSLNGHSDVMLGLLVGPRELWSRVPGVLSMWGLTAAPFECWAALRGLETYGVRAARAVANALAAANHLVTGSATINSVFYPGLPNHPDHDLACRQFDGGFGSLVTFTLSGGLPAAEAFIAAGTIPFCPSLGENCTTLTHPASTSHRALSAEARRHLGIHDGTIRLSLGIESSEAILLALDAALAAARAV